MQQKYIDHYLLMATTKFLSQIEDRMGGVPFGAVVKNYLYYPDHTSPGKLRIQSFLENLVKFQDKLRDQPDPEPPPKLIEIGKTPSFTPQNIKTEGGISLEDLLGEELNESTD